MAGQILYDNLDEFLTALKGSGISHVAFAEVHERRAEQTKDDLLEVIVLKKVEIIGYKESILHKYSEKNHDPDALLGKFAAAGIEVTKRDRNIT